MYCGIVFEVVNGNIWVVCGMSMDRTETAVLEMTGRQVAKCDQKIILGDFIWSEIRVFVCVFVARSREYARGRRERRNRFRPADIAFFSSESDKNVTLIFRKIRCFSIHLNKHTSSAGV